MRWVLLILLAGCGRFRFDAATVASDATDSDDGAPADAVLPDSVTGFNITTPVCPLSDFTSLGVATCTPGAIDLTSDTGSEVGAIWLTKPITFGPTTSFSIELTVQLIHNNSLPNGPGDGMTIVVQNDPRGTAAIGGTGGSLAYEAMSPSSAVELDTFKGPNDTFAEEVGIDADGDTNNELVVAQPPFLLTNGTPFTVWVDYTGATHRIAVSIAQSTTKPSTPIAMQTDDLSRLGSAWFGLTAATESSSETHRVLSWKLVVTP
jgi:hypothetical protein